MRVAGVFGVRRVSVIYNWPDRCPSCGGGSFTATGREAARLVHLHGRPGLGADLPKNTLRFTCADPMCRHEWRVELAAITPVVFVHPRMRPMAVVAASVADAEMLTALPDGWRAETLVDLLGRGADRVAFVTAQAEGMLAASPPDVAG